MCLDMDDLEVKGAQKVFKSGRRNAAAGHDQSHVPCTKCYKTITFCIEDTVGQMDTRAFFPCCNTESIICFQR